MKLIEDFSYSSDAVFRLVDIHKKLPYPPSNIQTNPQARYLMQQFWWGAVDSVDVLTTFNDNNYMCRGGAGTVQGVGKRVEVSI